MAIDLEAIRRRVQELSGANRNSNIQMWKPEVGEYKVRGLPCKEAAEGMPFVERWFYFIGQERGFLTPKQFGKQDPVAEFIRQLYQSGKKEDREVAKKLQPKMYAYMPMIIRGQEDKGVVVWKFSKQVYQQLLAFFATADDDGTVFDILDAEQGFDLNISVTQSPKKVEGKSFLDFKVTIPPGRKPSKLHADAATAKKWLEGIPNVDDMNKQKSPQEIETILNNWLNAGTDQASTSDGTSRGATSTDELDKLAEELKSDAKPAAAPVADAAEEEEAKPAASKRSTKKASAPVDDLDKAFEDLKDLESN